MSSPTRSTRRTTLFAAGLLASCGIAGAAAAADAAKTPPPPEPIGGSWRATVGTDGPDPIIALFSFHSDGTVLETGSLLGDESFGDLTLSHGHGCWFEGADGTVFAYEKVLLDPEGHMIGHSRCEGTIEQNGGGALTGSLDVTVVDPDGSSTKVSEGRPFVMERISA